MVYSLPLSNAVRTRLSPATIGDENPPGTRTFHFTFLSGPNSTGGFWSSATADPPGPRNCGQASGLSAPSPTDANKPTAMDVIHPLMSSSSMEVITDRRREMWAGAGASVLRPVAARRFPHAELGPRIGPLPDTIHASESYTNCTS